MTPSPSRLASMLIELEGALSAAGIRHAVAGGIAMSAHGRPRATDDIDLLADAAQTDALRAVMHGLGYHEETPGQVATRYIRRPTADMPSLAEWVDVLFATRASGRRLIERAEAAPIEWANTPLPVVDPAGLVLMKVLALTDNPARHTDADDINFLLQSHADVIDLNRLRRDAAEIGPDVEATLDAILEAGIREPIPAVGRLRL